MKFIKRFDTEEGYKDFTKGEEVIVADFSAEQLLNEILNTYCVSEEWILNNSPIMKYDKTYMALPEDKTDVYILMVSTIYTFYPLGLLSEYGPQLAMLGGEYTDEYLCMNWARMRDLMKDAEGGMILEFLKKSTFILMKNGTFIDSTNPFTTYILDIFGETELDYVDDITKIAYQMYYTPNGVISDRNEIEKLYKTYLDSSSTSYRLLYFNSDNEIENVELTRELLDSFTSDEKIMILKYQLS